MASRDDYPALAAIEDKESTALCFQVVGALNEIDRLRAEVERWKERAEEYRQNYWYQRMVTRER